MYSQIEDENDEFPTFSQESYSFNVAENKPQGTRVGLVNAVDLDSPPYNQFEYSLVPSHGSVNFFNIHPQTGEITTSIVLDREETAVYNLIVSANDLMDAEMSSTATVIITLLDSNDNAPTFEYPSSDNNTIQMSNLAHLGYEVTHVRAIDRDISRNGNLTYEFYKGNEGGYFNIDSLTGSISVAESLKHIDYHLYQFVIVARDQGVPQMSAMTNLNIVVNKSIPFPYTQKPHLIGPNTTIVVSLTCISIVIVLVLIVAIVLIRRQDKNKKSQKYLEALKVLSAKDAPRDAENMGSGNNLTAVNAKTIQPREATVMSVGNGKILVAETTELQTFSVGSKSPSVVTPVVTPRDEASGPHTTGADSQVHVENSQNHNMDAHQALAAQAAAVAASRDHNSHQYLPEVSLCFYQ